jgi:PilZ domain-containing protein
VPPIANPALPCPSPIREPEQELRAYPRARVFKGAVISYDDHHFTIPCTVRNISEGGALLQILEKLVVPDTFVLLIELDSVETDCKVIWRHEDVIGVEFLSPLRPVKRARAQVVSESNPQQNSSLRRHPVS